LPEITLFIIPGFQERFVRLVRLRGSPCQARRDKHRQPGQRAAIVHARSRCRCEADILERLISITEMQRQRKRKKHQNTRILVLNRAVFVCLNKAGTWSRLSTGLHDCVLVCSRSPAPAGTPRNPLGRRILAKLKIQIEKYAGEVIMNICRR